jgi:hypothetical protein
MGESACNKLSRHAHRLDAGLASHWDAELAQPDPGPRGLDPGIGAWHAALWKDMNIDTLPSARL